MTSYVENTLATSGGGATMIHECLDSLMPTMTKFREAESDAKPLMMSRVHRFKPPGASSIDGDGDCSDSEDDRDVDYDSDRGRDCGDESYDESENSSSSSSSVSLKDDSDRSASDDDGGDDKNKNNKDSDDENMIGTLESVAAGFHARYQPVLTAAKLEKAVPGKAIDVNTGEKPTVTCCSRISVGYGQIAVCCSHAGLIRVYNVNGGECRDVNSKRQLGKALCAAAFASETSLVVSASGCLAILSIHTSKVTSVLKDAWYSDVFCHENKVCGLDINKKTVDVFTQLRRKWEITCSVW